MIQTGVACAFLPGAGRAWKKLNSLIVPEDRLVSVIIWNTHKMVNQIGINNYGLLGLTFATMKNSEYEKAKLADPDSIVKFDNLKWVYSNQC